MKYSFALKNIGKKYNRHWIFKAMDRSFQGGDYISVTGHNGSGKSTLMRILSGVMKPTQGQVQLCCGDQPIKEEELYNYVSLCAPQMDIPDELNLLELLEFHFKFKATLPSISIQDIPMLIQLDGQENKPISQYSSGMRQRVKLGLAILSNTPLLILDEPTTNLDVNGVNWYYNLVEKYIEQRIVFIASNQEREYYFCNASIHLPDYASNT